MNKKVFLCPNCNNYSTYTRESIALLNKNTLIYTNTLYLVLRCDACNKLTFKVIQTGIEIQGKYVDQLEIFQYPFSYIKIEETLPKKIKEYLIEAYQCYHINALKASAAMCRTILYTICEDKNTQGKDFKEKIEKLPLSKRLKLVAKNIKWIGDKTLHHEVDWTRVNWNKKTVEEMLNFIERIIDDLYIQERKAKELNKLVSETSSKKIKLKK